jgi:hypothetical protein
VAAPDTVPINDYHGQELASGAFTARLENGDWVIRRGPMDSGGLVEIARGSGLTDRFGFTSAGTWVTHPLLAGSPADRIRLTDRGELQYVDGQGNVVATVADVQRRRPFLGSPDSVRILRPPDASEALESFFQYVETIVRNYVANVVAAPGADRGVDRSIAMGLWGEDNHRFHVMAPLESAIRAGLSLEAAADAAARLRRRMADIRASTRRVLTRVMILDEYRSDFLEKVRSENESLNQFILTQIQRGGPGVTDRLPPAAEVRCMKRVDGFLWVSTNAFLRACHQIDAEAQTIIGEATSLGGR